MTPNQVTAIRVAMAFAAAALRFRVRAAFFAAKLCFVGMGVPFVSCLALSQGRRGLSVALIIPNRITFKPLSPRFSANVLETYSIRF